MCAQHPLSCAQPAAVGLPKVYGSWSAPVDAHASDFLRLQSGVQSTFENLQEIVTWSSCPPILSCRTRSLELWLCGVCTSSLSWAECGA